MICKNCGTDVAEGFAYCTNCGAQLEASQPAAAVSEPAVRQTAEDPGKTLGIVSLILGILSLVSGGFPAASVVGIILGNMAKKKSAEAGFANGSANIGVILSIIGLVVFVIVVVATVALYSLGMIGAIASGM